MKFMVIPILTTLVALEVHAANWEALVQKLTQTRLDVESLSKELDSEQRERQAELDLWSGRKSELEAQVQKEKLRELQINEKLKYLESRVKVQGKSDPQAQKKLVQWISQYENWVLSSIPFMQETRLAQLQKMKDRVEKSHEALEFVFSDFWSFVENEIKLAQTNEYHIVDVNFGDKKKKCEVARLGLQTLYVVSSDKKVYMAIKEAKGWVWKDILKSEEQNSILSLVKNLKDKNSSGYYLLPVNQGSLGASL